MIWVLIWLNPMFLTSTLKVVQVCRCLHMLTGVLSRAWAARDRLELAAPAKESRPPRHTGPVSLSYVTTTRDRIQCFGPSHRRELIRLSLNNPKPVGLWSPHISSIIRLQLLFFSSFFLWNKEGRQHFTEGQKWGENNSRINEPVVF